SGDFVRTLVIPEDQAALDAAFAAADGGHEFALDARSRTTSGLLKHLRIVARPSSYFPDRLAVVGAVQDITERKAAEEALRESEVELARVMRLTTIGELVASITHEITQPLTAIASNGRASQNWLGREVPDLAEA